MGTLIRQGHFLGTKLRSLRKRNGLTLDELSARCVQIDAAGAPSVSYLSMVETGKRMPSADMLDMLAGIFSKDARWFLDENSEVEASIVMKDCSIRNIPGRIDSSLLADNSQVVAAGHVPAAHRFILAENSYVQL